MHHVAWPLADAHWMTSRRTAETKGEASVMAGIEIYKDFIESDFDIDQYIIKGTL